MSEIIKAGDIIGGLDFDSKHDTATVKNCLRKYLSVVEKTFHPKDRICFKLDSE